MPCELNEGSTRNKVARYKDFYISKFYVLCFKGMSKIGVLSPNLHHFSDSIDSLSTLALLSR